jgi:hypothetical protein
LPSGRLVGRILSVIPIIAAAPYMQDMRGTRG